MNAEIGTVHKEATIFIGLQAESSLFGTIDRLSEQGYDINHFASLEELILAVAEKQPKLLLLETGFEG